MVVGRGWGGGGGCWVFCLFVLFCFVFRCCLSVWFFWGVGGLVGFFMFFSWWGGGVVCLVCFLMSLSAYFFCPSSKLFSPTPPPPPTLLSSFSTSVFCYNVSAERFSNGCDVTLTGLLPVPAQSGASPGDGLRGRDVRRRAGPEGGCGFGGSHLRRC